MYFKGVHFELEVPLGTRWIGILLGVRGYHSRGDEYWTSSSRWLRCRSIEARNVWGGRGSGPHRARDSSF